MKFAEKIKCAREELNLNQTEMAEKLGVSRRTYIRYEQGDCIPRDHKVMEKAADLLGVSIDYLFDGRDEFILKAEDTYGYRGKIQARKILDETEQLCAGGSLSPADEEKFQEHMFQIFNRMKERNRIRYAQARELAEKKPEDK